MLHVAQTAPQNGFRVISLRSAHAPTSRVMPMPHIRPRERPTALCAASALLFPHLTLRFAILTRRFDQPTVFRNPCALALTLDFRDHARGQLQNLNPSCLGSGFGFGVSCSTSNLSMQFKQGPMRPSSILCGVRLLHGLHHSSA